MHRSFPSVPTCPAWPVVADEVDSEAAGVTVVVSHPVEDIAVATVAGVAAMRPTKGMVC